MFGRLIEDCRKHVARGQGGWLRRLGFAPTPLQMDPRDEVPATLRPHYEQLLREGEVVWGHVVMANYQMYAPGPGPSGQRGLQPEAALRRAPGGPGRHRPRR